MKLKAYFCCGEGDGRGDLHTTEADTIEEIKEWANELSRKKRYRSVFKEEFHVKSDAGEQWGTNYYWLQVTSQ